MLSSSSKPAPPPIAAPPRQRSTAKTALVTFVLMAAAFAAGFVPKQIEATRATRTLGATTFDLRLANLHRRLGVASHEAANSNYPAAGAAAQAFFEGCRTLAGDPALKDHPRTSIALASYASSANLTLERIALGDPAVREHLASLYLTMHGVIERGQ